MRSPLKKHREDKLCLSLKDIAEIAEVTPQTVHYWESEGRLPRSEKRRLAAEAYELTLKNFLRKIREGKKQSPVV